MNDKQAKLFDSFWENPRFWIAVIFIGCIFRVWEVLVLQNPLDALFSDPGRHWDNAGSFLNPGPMGNANAIFYQFWLHFVQFLTQGNRYAVAGCSALLSLSLVYFWFLFAREVLQSHLRVLRFTAMVCWLPSMSFMYMYFMSETLLLPLMGAALWMTWRSVRLNSPLAFFVAFVFWLCATLTRPVVLPGAIICLMWGVSEWRRRLTVVLACIVFAAVALVLSARHSYEHFGFSSALGHDGILNSIYFFSGKKTWTITFAHGYWYIYESPSFSFSPFDPFFDWETSRKGTIDILQDRTLGGLDLQERLYGQIYQNYPRVAELIWENVVYFFFGHSWPEANKDRLDGLIVFWERWFWLPICLWSMVACAREMYRERRIMVLPLVVLILTLFSAFAPVAVMEGRYRKPVALLWIISIFWSLERRSGVSGCGVAKKSC